MVNATRRVLLFDLRGGCGLYFFNAPKHTWRRHAQNAFVSNQESSSRRHCGTWFIQVQHKLMLRSHHWTKFADALEKIFPATNSSLNDRPHKRRQSGPLLVTKVVWQHNFFRTFLTNSWWNGFVSVMAFCNMEVHPHAFVKASIEIAKRQQSTMTRKWTNSSNLQLLGQSFPFFQMVCPYVPRKAKVKPARQWRARFRAQAQTWEQTAIYLRQTVQTEALIAPTKQGCALQHPASCPTAATSQIPQSLWAMCLVSCPPFSHSNARFAHRLGGRFAM